MEERRFSCIDCAVVACNSNGKKEYPAFCPTKALPEEARESVLAAYQGEAQEMMRAAARVDYEGNDTWPRVQEVIEFAHKMGYERLGIATCVALIREARSLAALLRGHGFAVYGIGCKIGAVQKTEIGIDELCMQAGKATCNPILQARLLGEAKTQFNIVLGLCVGHDTLFFQNSEAPCTMLVAKDRVLGHNPVAALYTLDTFYKKLKAPEAAK